MGFDALLQRHELGRLLVVTERCRGNLLVAPVGLFPEIQEIVFNRDLVISGDTNKKIVIGRVFCLDINK